MTMPELKSSTALYVEAVDVAPVLKLNPQSIRDAAHTHPEMLGFPVCVVGNKTMIPRVPFIRFWEGT